MPVVPNTFAIEQQLSTQDQYDSDQQIGHAPIRVVAWHVVVVVGIVALVTFTVGGWVWHKQDQVRQFILANRDINLIILFIFAAIQVYAILMAMRIERASRSEGKSAWDKLERCVRVICRPWEATKINTQNIRQVLDNMAIRLDHTDQWLRYGSSSLLFLGLLGTFFGLLGTVSGVSEIFDSLANLTGQSGDVLKRLNYDLSRPISGMKTAFSSSFIGLSGSLICGLSALALRQGHARFLNEAENIYAKVTKDTAVQDFGMDDESHATLKILVKSNVDTITRLEKLCERQIKLMSTQTVETDAMRLAIVLEKRIEQVENILVRLAASIHEISKSLPEQNLYKEVGETMRRIEATFLDAIMMDHAQQKKRLIEQQDFRDYLSNELHTFSQQIILSSPKQKQTVSQSR